VPKALDEVDKLMANAGDALLIASWLILAIDRALVSIAGSDRSNEWIELDSSGDSMSSSLLLIVLQSSGEEEVQEFGD
jgi:hypothetical protein